MSTRLVLATGLVAVAASLLVAAAPSAKPSVATRSCSTSFVASVLHGPRKGTDYRGVLTLRSDWQGRLRGGSFRSQRGGRVAVTGSSHGRAIRFSLRTRDGMLRGTGAVKGSLRYCAGRLVGQLKGPGRGNRGGWLATTGQTVTLPGDVQLFTSAETANTANPQVVFRAQGISSPTTVFAGGLNVAGNIDGQRLAARMNRPSGLGYDASRSLVYIADVSNAAIRRLDMTTNQVTTLLTQSAAVAAARALGYTTVTGWEPQGVAVSGSAVLIADVRNFVVWKYSPNMAKFTLYAGMPGSSGNNDGLDAAVRFSAPQQIVAQANGLVVVAEPTRNRIRMREPSSGRWSTLGVCC